MIHRVPSSSLSVLGKERSEPNVCCRLVVEGGGRLLLGRPEQLQRGQVLDDHVVLEQVGDILQRGQVLECIQVNNDI